MQEGKGTARVGDEHRVPEIWQMRWNDGSTLCNMNGPLPPSRTSSEVSHWSSCPATCLRSGWAPWRSRVKRTGSRPWSSKLPASSPEARPPQSPSFDSARNCQSGLRILQCLGSSSGIVHPLPEYKSRGTLEIFKSSFSQMKGSTSSKIESGLQYSQIPRGGEYKNISSSRKYGTNS